MSKPTPICDSGKTAMEVMIKSTYDAYVAALVLALTATSEKDVNRAKGLAECFERNLNQTQIDNARFTASTQYQEDNT